MSDKTPPLSWEFLAQIGLITALWSAIEAAMQIAILRIQEIDLPTGMVVTSELGFRQRYNLLMTLANEPGGIEPETDALALKSILKRIWNAYPKRNAAVHPLWVATDDPLVAKRMGVRAKGRLRVISEPVNIKDLAKDAEEIRQIGSDLSAFMERKGLTAEGGIENIT